MLRQTLPAELTEVLRPLESAYPAEGCGVILRAGASGPFRVRPLQNVIDRYHARDPVRFPRTSRTAYRFDPREWLQVSEEAEARGEQVVCVFHSHGDAGAYFSQEDREMAAPDGEPVLPGVSYLVVAVDAGRASAARLFWWDAGDWREASVPLGAGP